MFLITDIEQYDYCVGRGIEPLLDTNNFQIEISLRVEIQKKLFGHCEIGRGDIPAANQRFFKWVWNHKPHYCEECLRPLKRFAAIYCSHILSRGAHPELSHDVRNINILCAQHHNQYEFGDRENMRIMKKNAVIIQKLKDEYNKLK